MIETLRAKLQSINSYLVLVPLLVAVSVIALSLWATIVASGNLNTAKSQAIDRTLRENRIRMAATIRSYAQLANGGVARINSGEITQAEWDNYAGSYDLSRNYPGVFTFGVNTVVSDSTQQFNFEAVQSGDYGRPIAVFPATDATQKAPVTYVAPQTERTLKGIGFDSYTEPERKLAMDQAAAENEIIISNKLELLQDPAKLEKSSEPSFLMYAPFYDKGTVLSTEADRKAALRGYVFLAFEARNVLGSFFETSDLSRTSVVAYIGSNKPEDKVYEADANASVGKTTTASQTLDLYGQRFMFDYTFDDESLVSRAQLTTPFAILITGIMLALMLATITFFSLRSRHLKLLFEKERDIKTAKDELLSLASHQLRTPATGVKQYMGMVLQGFAGNISSLQQEYLEKAYDSNERQLQIINDILHLAKLDAGRIVLSKRDFDLAEMVRSVADEQSGEANKGGLKLRVVAPKKAIYFGDAHMMRMVLENLTSNAIKYSPSGSKVNVTLKKNLEGYKVIVSDTGVGIAHVDFPKLFKQFSRISNERSHLVSGTGVGLYLADNLVRLHGGDITVESSPKKGSSFTVFLPFSV